MNQLVLAPTSLVDTPQDEYVEAAAWAGYKAVGIRLHPSNLTTMPFHPIVGDAAKIKRVKDTLKAAGMQIVDLLSFYVVPDINFDSYKAAMALGAELGGKYALVIGDDADKSRCYANFATLCELAAGFGLTCAVENASNRPIGTVPDVVAMIQASGVKNAVVCLDPLNHFRCGHTAADIARLDPKLFPYTQLSDGKYNPGEPSETVGRTAAGIRALPGEGDLPIPELFKVLPKGLPISIELPQSLSKALPGSNGQIMSPRDWAKVTYDRTKAYLERIGA